MIVEGFQWVGLRVVLVENVQVQDIGLPGHLILGFGWCFSLHDGVLSDRFVHLFFRKELI